MVNKVCVSPGTSLSNTEKCRRLITSNRIGVAATTVADRGPGIRRKILDGTLPKQNCRMTWYGPGTGGICVACEKVIAADDLEGRSAWCDSTGLTS
jgi:hypothetical protein